MAEDQGKVSTQRPEEAEARLRWERPEVRTMSAGSAELTAATFTDGGASYS